MDDLVLRPLAVGDEAEARAAHEELARDHFQFLLGERDGEPWADYVARVEGWADGRDLDEGQVPSTFLIAEVGGVLAGRVSIRHALNPWLAEVGGHIGYGVRPAFRRTGLATAMLRHGLVVDAEHGIDRALVCCHVDNAGSRAVIESCGGVYDRLTVEDGTVGRNRRYWVPTGV